MSVHNRSLEPSKRAGFFPTPASSLKATACPIVQHGAVRLRTPGGRLGGNIFTPNYDQQLLLEFAFLKAMGADATRIAPGDQAGLGARYQIPISNAWIFRSTAMHGFLEIQPMCGGRRKELRMRF
ncbi:MAG: hypothetical protein GY904_20890 [Planctomycetaceae bacterium]|nr:hypothetical protein [Planctomycetaceae bacterium]